VGLAVHLGGGLPAGRLRTSPVAVFARVTIPLMKARPTKPLTSVMEEGSASTSVRVNFAEPAVVDIRKIQTAVTIEGDIPRSI
jgi:hypothetical protein